MALVSEQRIAGINANMRLISSQSQVWSVESSHLRDRHGHLSRMGDIEDVERPIGRTNSGS